MTKTILFAFFVFQVVNALITIDSQLPSYTVNQQIVVFYSVYDDFLDGDFIGIFQSGNCPSTNDCPEVYSYIDSGSLQNFTGNVTFEYGVPFRGSIDIRYLRGDYTFVTSINGITVAATATLSTPNFIWIGEPIHVSFTSTPFHSEFDWIGMFKPGECPTTNDCSLAWITVPIGSSGSVVFDGIDYDTFEVEFRYLFDYGYDALTTSSTVAITAAANITYTGNLISGSPIIVTFHTSPYHSPYDWIGVFDDYLCDVNADCVTYGTSSVPPGSSGTIVLSNYAPPNQTVHLRYVIPSSKTIYKTAVAVVRETNGQCASGCSNAGNACGFETDCNDCGTDEPKCVPNQPPEFILDTPDYGSNFNVLTGGKVTFSVIATGVDAPITISFGGLPSIAQVTNQVSGNVTNATVSFIPTDSMASTTFEVCFVATSSLATASDYRCIDINVKGSVCYSSGDPHIATFDGLFYDFQGVGDFYMLKKVSGSAFSVQARFQQCFEDAEVTCNRALAFKVGKNTITSYFAPDTVPEVYVNGILYSEGNYTVEGGYVDIESNDLIISFPNIINVAVTGLSYLYPVLVVSLPGSNAGTLIGLCGNFDTDPDNDFVSANGTSLSSSSTPYAVYYDFGLTWRIEQSESLFNYSRTGANYTEVNNMTYVPLFSASFSDPDLQSWATQLCSAGLTGDAYESCLFDVAVTGNLSNARASYDAHEASCLQSSLSTNCRFNANCPSQCNFRGICTNNVCQCLGYYTGSSCAQMSSTTSTGATSTGATSTGASSTGTDSSSSSIQSSFLLAIVTFLFMYK